MRALAPLILAVVLPAQVSAGQGDLVRIIGCPIYRDVDNGRKSGCWLVDDRQGGTRFDVSGATTRPDWNYEVLVEGRVAAVQDNACGGVMLEPVRVSVLDQPCLRHQLPAEGFKGRPFVLPLRNVRPLSEARPPLTGPFTDQTFHVFFDFDRSFVTYQGGDYQLDQALYWIRTAKPQQIVVTGYAVTKDEMVSGRRLAEHAAVASARAEVIAEALRRGGIDPARIKVRTRTNAAPLDGPDAEGLVEASRRRVDIEAVMQDGR